MNKKAPTVSSGLINVFVRGRWLHHSDGLFGFKCGSSDKEFGCFQKHWIFTGSFNGLWTCWFFSKDLDRFSMLLDICFSVILDLSFH